MLVIAVDLELGRHLTAHLGLGEHALNGFLDDFFGAALEQAKERLLAQTAGEAGVAAIHLFLRLEAGEANLFGIDHDDVIAHIDVRGVLRATLAGEDAGDLGGEAAEGLAGGVGHEPLAFDLKRAGNKRRHLFSSKHDPKRSAGAGCGR